MADRKRLLNDLRVIDLRTELEKRNLDKSGVRGVLIQRLSKYLEEQGIDPATYKFELSTPEGKTPTKATRRSGSIAEPEAEETPAMEDMIVQDDAADDETEGSEAQNENNNSTELDDKATEKMDIDENQKPNRKREIKEKDNDATEAKKPCLDDSKNEDLKLESNTDAEDSINLDIGDDELLNDEADNTSKQSKDESGHTEEAAPADVSKKSTDAATKDDNGGDTQQQVNNEAAANSNEDQKVENDKKDEKGKDDEADKKDKKDDTAGGARNLWVSGLSGDTRAKDLKQLCSKHGKVIGAKVVTNARTPGSRCYGYVTMASAQDAENCIKNLHRTELHGRMISVEKARSESESASRRPVRPEPRPKEETKEKEDGKESDKEKKEGEEHARSQSRSREKSRGENKERSRRSTRSRERKRSPREVLSFSKIWKERDVARARERSRALREEERRRRAAEDALRERERRQRQEKHRLELEREKLRAEREKIEREKNELLRLERERHRLEREKLELERLELKRAQLRLEEERRKRGYESSGYRKPSPPPEPYRDAHKRAPPSSSRGTFEAPPPPRFEVSGGYERTDKRDREREYKREYPRHVSSNMKYPSNGAAADDARQPPPPGTRPKDASARSYDSRGDTRYRSPGAKPEPRAWPTRYPDPTANNKGNPGANSGAAPGADWPSAESRYPAAYPERYAAYPQQTAYPDRYYRKY